MINKFMVHSSWFIVGIIFVVFFVVNFLLFVNPVYADFATQSRVDEPPLQQTATNPNLQGIFGSVNAPSQLQSLFGSTTPEEGISTVLSLVIQLIYVIAAIIFVFYLLYSGLQFIYSEGSKEAVAEARGRITWAIVGIIFLALVFVLLRVLSIVTGFTFFN